ncbi:LuxR C-terminal-related transcriptional regulator [Azospirillum ramasamyi]|uniref:LuxR C-terminal-related transcriptional regulator n=1 Tax=Azospirillum ramasamyi TaxID=682998 RepID=UPI001FE93B53|nr:response regulator transcription factor [Azospirillum ramasamyi]
MDHHAQHVHGSVEQELASARRSPSDDPFKFLIVDDHALVRYGLSLALRQRYEGAVIVEAGSLAEAMRKARSESDLTAILYDLQMGDSDQHSGLADMLEAAGDVPVIVVSGATDGTVIASCIRAGARGFVHKGCEGVVLDQALPIVLDGGIFAPAPPAARDGRPVRIAMAASVPVRTDSDAVNSLTERQREVLRLLLEGQSNKEIARALGVLEGTIKVHLRTVMQRLGVRNRTQLALATVRAGIKLQS